MLIDAFDNAVTDVRAIHITSDVAKLVVTANAEQIPNICNIMGLLLIKASNKTFLLFDSIIFLSPYAREDAISFINAP